MKKCKIRAITAFKVIKVGTNRKLECDFLVVINSNWHLISYHFGVIAAYFSNFEHFTFSSHPLGSLGTTYDVHLGLIGRRVVDFVLVLIELFSLGVTADACCTVKIITHSQLMNAKNNFTPAITTRFRPALTSQSRLESYKRLISVSSQNLNVLSRSHLGWWSQCLGLGRCGSWSRLSLEL